MPVVVEGYEDGYDSLTADRITVVEIVPDVAKADLTSIVGDHQHPEKLPEADDDISWGGEWAQLYTADARASAAVRALLLPRRDNQRTRWR